MMKRLILVILAVTAVLTLVSCGKPKDSDILAEYKALYEKAKEVNKIIYGQGLPYDGEFDKAALTSPHYVAVSQSSPYKTEEEIKAAVLEVYTEDYYLDAFKRVLFDGHTDDYATINARYKTVDGVLMTDVTYEGFASIAGGRCDTAQAYVVRSSRGSAEVGAPYFLNDVKQASDKKVTMLLTENGWRFDNLA